MTHRFFTDHNYLGSTGMRELPPPPWNDALPAEFRYVYDVLEQALPHVKAEGLRFYFTKEAYFLPEYGPDVVVILLQEERYKVRVYGRNVRAVIRNLLTVPHLGWRPHLHLGKPEAVLTFEFLRNCYTSLRSRAFAKFPPEYLPAPIRKETEMMTLPLGYHRQVELPQVAMRDRKLDTFFAGQVRHEIASGYLRWTSTSKFEVREQLWRELNLLAKQGKWKIDLGNIAADEQGHAQYDSFSEKMMQSKICVSPRGTFAECYRTYEGLRAGCMVVVNRHAKDEFLYPGAPLVFVDHWRELGGILERYANNYDALEEFRAKSLAWWHDRLRPEVQARKIIAGLNHAGDTLTV